MTGISEVTGRPLSRSDHIRQSIAILFKTRIGSRVIRRHVGSNVPNLVDEPALNDETRFELIVAVATAILEFEPRVALEVVEPRVLSAGKVEIILTARDKETGESMRLEQLLR